MLSTAKEVTEGAVTYVGAASVAVQEDSNSLQINGDVQI